MTVHVQKCQICGTWLNQDDDEEFQEGRDDPNLCSLCQEVVR